MCSPLPPNVLNKAKLAKHAVSHDHVKCYRARPTNPAASSGETVVSHNLLKRFILFSACAVMVLGFGALPASAQATRTWVSGVGDDVNPCSRTAPCKTFAGAISKTASGGEINCLDPGGFGAVTITKPITIQCIGVEGGLLVAGTNGIVVAAGANDVVNIVGLDIFGVSNAPDGIKVISARQVHIHDCIIRGFSTSGVHVIPNAGVNTYVLVSDSIFDNNLFGVAVTSTNGGGAVATAFLDHLTIMGTGASGAGFGVAIDGSQGSAILNNSTIVRNGTGISFGAGTLLSMGNNRVPGPSNSVPVGQQNGTAGTFNGNGGVPLPTL